MSFGRFIIKYLLFSSLLLVHEVSIAIDCYSLSSYAASGKDLFTVQSFPSITEKQQSLIQQILKNASGTWKGTMVISECFGSRSEPTVKVKVYDVSGEGHLDGQHYHLAMNTFYREGGSSGSRTVTLALIDSYLSIDEAQTGKVEIVALTRSGVNYYKRFRQNFPGRGISIPKENNYVLEASKNRLIIKETLYVNGELSSETKIELR